MSPLFKFLLVTLILVTAGGVWWHSSSGAFTTINLTLTTNPTLETGLAGHYTFDGPYVDLSQTSAEIRDSGATADDHGNWSYAEQTLVPGVLGQAIQFASSSDYVSIPNDNGFEADTLTVMAWVKIDAPIRSGMEPHTIAQKETDSDSDGWNLRVMQDEGSANAHTFMFVGTDSGVKERATSTTVVEPYTWYHVAVTNINGGETKIYVNGVLETTATISRATAPTDTKLGLEDDSSGVFCCGLNGSLDDVRIYNRALSAEEVKRLYGLGATTKIAQTITTNPTLETGLVGHWTFDGPDVDWSSETAEVKDRSGNGNHGNAMGGMTAATSPILGVLGQGVAFIGGGTQAVKVPSTSQFDIATNGSFSQSLWFRKTTDCGTPSNEVMSSRFGVNDNDGTWWFGCEASTDYIALSFFGWVGEARLRGPIVDDGEWHHAGWSYNGSSGEVLLYLDGSLVNSETYTLDLNMDIANPLCIGGYDAQCDHDVFEFDGSLDDVRIYDRALSADEVKRLYELGR